MRTFSVLLALAALLFSCKSSDPTPQDLRDRIDSISVRVEHLRGEKFEHPVQGRYLARADLLRIYDSVSFEEPDPADSAWDRMLWSLGFVDSLGALDNAADSVDESSIQAFYSRGVLWVVDDTRDSGELDVTIAHELTHALQDQRWDMVKLYREHRGLDARLSLQYLLEGEARLVETLYAHNLSDSVKALALFPQLSLEQFRDSLRAGDGLEPEMVTLPTYHPYEQGARALAWRWAHGGWKAVDDWFRQIPSTSCFLHPEQECRPPLRLAIETPPPVRQDWTLLREGTVGEHYLDILFSLWSHSDEWIPRDSLKAGAILSLPWRDPGPDAIVDGWRGDNFRIWRDDEGELAMLWKTAWCDTGSAERFFQGYRRLMVRKMRDDRLIQTAPGMDLFFDDESVVWDRVQRFGSQVWIAEGMRCKVPFAFPGSLSR
jgi:hypothetical protein